MARLVEGMDTVLDIGCTHIPNPYIDVTELTGLDLFSPSLPPNYSKFIKIDFYDIPTKIDTKYDAVVLGEVLEHVENPFELLRIIKSILKTNGVIVLSTPNPNSFFERILTLNLSRKYYYASDHKTLYPQRWLIRILELSGFKNVKLYSGGIQFPGLDLIPFPRPWCYQTIAKATVGQ